MRKHTCHLIHHQRSRYVTIGLEGKVSLGDTVDQESEGEVVRQSQGEIARRTKFLQTTQPIPKPICDRSGQPDSTQDVFIVKSETSRSQEIDVKSFHEELCSSDRSQQPDKCSDAVHHEIKMLNTDNELLRERIEEDMDFQIPGLPHSIVKHAQSTSVRQLIQKIENDPNRHALQRDLQQSQSFNPFSQESKQMIP